MCWKKSLPDPAPTPAMSTQVTVTGSEAAGSSICSGDFLPCNSTTLRCYNGGVACCHQTLDPLCACQSGWEPPNCLLQDVLYGASSFRESMGATIGVVAFIVGILLVIAITVSVLVWRRHRRLTSRGQNNMNRGQELQPLKSVTTDSANASSHLSKDTNGNDKGAS